MRVISERKSLVKAVINTILSLASAPVLFMPVKAMSNDNGESNEKILEEVVVHGFQRNYLQSSAESAVGLNLNLMDTPAAVSVITQDILQDQQVNNVDDALRNVAAVTKFKTGNGGEEKF